jgi:molecular chaperone DnaK (HSP70)
MSLTSIKRNGNFEIIPNQQGYNMTPSSVMLKDFPKAGRLAGSWFPERAIVGSQRLVGRKFDESEVQREINQRLAASSLLYTILLNNIVTGSGPSQLSRGMASHSMPRMGPRPLTWRTLP